MKTFKRVLIGFIVVFLVGAAFMGQIPSGNYLKAARVSHSVLNLPVGSSKSQVMALLNKEGLEYSYDGDKDGIDGTSDVKDNGYTSADLSGYIVAIIRNTKGGFIISGDVQYFFFFDKKGNLLRATVEEVFTGP